ncbi:MAG: shikimate dehydrogenase [Oscillospiraceae bacterium]|nr:shikimate dehydrogenase [Oscillospiraceae bacterium]
MSVRLCVIGDPVAHSLSPRLHEAMLRALGIEGTYEACRVREGETETFFHAARMGAYSGFNVTMPHKKAAFDLADELTDAARRAGAVNTVRVENGRAIGHNTDGTGFLCAIEARTKYKTAVIFGAGGAARSVAIALADDGWQVRVANRTPQHAQALAALSPNICTMELLEAVRDCALFVNATPLGMEGGKADFEDLAFLRALPKSALVCDLVYRPAETALLRAAGEQGLDTMNGLPMLCHQAVDALAFFLDKPLDHDEMMAALQEVCI